MNRLVPDRPFPPYTFVPGFNIHPYHPGGHSYGQDRARVPALAPDRWWESETYLYGIDLFNGPALLPQTPPPGFRGTYSGYYWEAHETWEGLWHASGRKGCVADFLKALIALAAAGVKALEGRPAGVRGHASRAVLLLQGVARELNSDSFLGLSLAELTAQADEMARSGWPTEAPVLRPGSGNRV